MKKIMVIGATSYIAIGLMKLYLKEECRIYAVIRPNSKNRYKIPENFQIVIVELEMNEFGKLERYMVEPVDICYYFAWEGVRGAGRFEKSIQEKNFIAFKKVLNECIVKNAGTFIGLGSWAEYGENSGTITEEMEEKPENEYGFYKLQAYQYGKEKAGSSDIKFMWGRLFSAYGIGENAATLIMTCIRKMLKNETIELSLCEHIWDYIYLDDVIRVLYLFGSYPKKCEVFNIAAGENRKLKEYIYEMKEILKSESELKFGAIPYEKSSEKYNMQPDIQKLKEQYDFVPEVAFKIGIQRIAKVIMEDEKNQHIGSYLQ